MLHRLLQRILWRSRKIFFFLQATFLKNLLTNSDVLKELLFEFDVTVPSAPDRADLCTSKSILWPMSALLHTRRTFDDQVSKTYNLFAKVKRSRYPTNVKSGNVTAKNTCLFEENCWWQYKTFIQHSDRDHRHKTTPPICTKIDPIQSSDLLVCPIARFPRLPHCPYFSHGNLLEFPLFKHPATFLRRFR